MIHYVQFCVIESQKATKILACIHLPELLFFFLSLDHQSSLNIAFGFLSLQIKFAFCLSTLGKRGVKQCFQIMLNSANVIEND